MPPDDRPVRVSFVCSGNICRSPTAEVVLRRLVHEAGLDARVEVESAGTGGWHVGDDMDERSAEELRRQGYVFDVHRARQFSPYDFARLDAVVALDEGHRRELLAQASTPQERAKVVLLGSFSDLDAADPSVPDPYYGGPHGFADVLSRVERGCRGLLDRLTS